MTRNVQHRQAFAGDGVITQTQIFCQKSVTQDLHMDSISLVKQMKTVKTL